MRVTLPLGTQWHQESREILRYLILILLLLTCLGVLVIEGGVKEQVNRIMSQEERDMEFLKSIAKGP